MENILSQKPGYHFTIMVYATLKALCENGMELSSKELQNKSILLSSQLGYSDLGRKSSNIQASWARTLLFNCGYINRPGWGKNKPTKEAINFYKSIDQDTEGVEKLLPITAAWRGKESQKSRINVTKKMNSAIFPEEMSTWTLARWNQFSKLIPQEAKEYLVKLWGNQ